jgi:23S rRNA (adenine2030-N6)-methyltransferase
LSRRRAFELPRWDRQHSAGAVNYRHAFHAGNFADVFKHALLARILIYLTMKDRPLRYLDTHAGIGRYDLFSSEARRSGEWREGVGRLASVDWPAEIAALLAPYLRALGPFGPDGAPKIYPGSPAIAQTLLRSQDRLILCEAHWQDAKALAAALGRDRRAKAIEIDGWTALKAYVPPPERRGLVLIDPPFESVDEFARMREGLQSAHAKWPTGVYALWYPLKDVKAAHAFCAALASDGIPRILRLELTVEAIRTDAPLAGCGLLVVNPPHVLEAEARALLPALTHVLARAPGASWTAEQIAE